MNGIILYKSKYGASPYDQKAFDAGIKNTFKGDLEGIPCYYCRGTFALQEMSFKDRTLCKLLRKAVSKKNPEDYEPWEKGLMEVRDDEKGDWTDISYVEPIIAALNGL